MGIAFLSFFLAWFAQGFGTASGWMGFFAAGLVSALLGWMVFIHLRGEELPTWMPWLLLGAVAFRLALGVFWFYALPQWGYPTEPQQAGYIMYDPYLRDNHAWQLAQSETPLIEAFRGYSPHDQYGGILYLSAWMYRYLGGEVHLPQLVLVLTSMVSGIGVVYLWAFTRRMWGRRAAAIAAVGLAVYPEAVLLGGAHMREAFTITLGAAIGYLVIHFWQERRKVDLVIFTLLLAFSLTISWAYVLMLSAVLGLFALGLIYQRLAEKGNTRWQWGIVALAGLVVGVGSKLFGRFLSAMGEFQGVLTMVYSGVVQAVFSRIPEFLHDPFLVGYGLLRPMLPAALIGKGDSLLWRMLGIWRAAGWTVILALLVYATLLVIKKKAWFSATGMLLWGNWWISMVAAYRAGGDMWDNPRYRAGFATFQLALSAWAIIEHKSHRDPLLRRVLVSVGLMLFWVVVWYLPRFMAVPWIAGPVEKKLGIGLLTVGLYLLWEWAGNQSQEAP